MSWECRLSRSAAKALRQVPPPYRAKLLRAIDELAQDPLSGDVRPIKSDRFKGTIRKSMGRYRIVFSLDPKNKVVEIAALLVRGERTYQ